MKCLLVSDLHYNLHQFDWLVKTAPDFDVTVIAGDLLDVSSPVSPQAQISVVLSYLKQINPTTKLIVSSGNHDLNGRYENGEKYAKWFSSIKRLGVLSDGDSYCSGDWLFTVYPWWDGPDVKAKIVSQLTADSKQPREKWVWIYHPPPQNTPVSWNGKKHFGDEDLLEWIDHYKPDVVLGGHVHQSPFSRDGSWVDQIGKTWAFNPGRQIGPFPTHIIFNFDLNEAVWFSLDGAECASFDKPIKRPVETLTSLPEWLSQ